MSSAADVVLELKDGADTEKLELFYRFLISDILDGDKIVDDDDCCG